MPRIGRIVVQGYPHHITQRGNYRQTVFVEKPDYQKYLELLELYAVKNNLLLLAYCLMPNHVHYIAVPQNDNSLAKTFNACHMRYSQYFNKKKRSFGHLWQGRFYSCVLDEPHLYAAIRYIENNPVRARLTRTAENWDWSSARYHISGERSIVTLANIDKHLYISNWKDYLMQIDDPTIIGKIKANTLTGRPLGSNVFVTKIERIFNIRLTPLTRGRPRKEH
ncbi:MAG: transposase [Candidatus Omnitrophica bacterium]|nr:transposase [Candidatus Omnitrophota bacterium]